MTTIQSSIDKLEALKEYIDYFVEDKIKDALKTKLNTFTFFEQTGCLMMPNYCWLPDFEIWYALKTKEHPLYWWDNNTNEVVEGYTETITIHLHKNNFNH